MNADRLLAHYEKIADAPDAIARLRRFILDLAVRGKLVPQDANDESASELLKRIASKRAELVKSGEMKPAKKILDQKKNEHLFELRNGWVWTTANELWDFENGDRSKNYPSKDQLVDVGIPFVNAGHLVCGRVDLSEMNYISRDKFQQLGGGKLRYGDQLYCLRGSLGKHARFLHEGDAAIASSLVILRPINHDVVPYLSCYLDSEIALAMLKRFDNGTAQPNLSSASLRIYQIPLPPLAEQHRIVAKVDELMGLCDRLEAARAGREAVRDRLAAASLARLNAPDPETFQDDACFALAALPALTTRPDQIKALRQTILNLAVRGKLVPQDASDEPASELLKRIAKEKARLVKAGEIKKLKALPDEEEPPFDLPMNWRWTPIREVASDRGQEVPQSAFTYIDVTAIDKERGVVADPKVLEASEAPSRARKITRKGDVIYSCVRPYLLNVAVIETDFDPQPIASTAFAILNGHGLVMPRYIWIVLRSPFMVACVEENQRGQAYPAINDADFAVLPFPLPPLAEQHRIVAKVDALMTFCDRLEASLTATAATRRRLADALLAEALAPVGAVQLEAAE